MSDSSPSTTPADPAIPATANTGAIAAMGLDLQEGADIPRKQIFSWALWDWATQPFNSVILTFVFSVYLVSDLFLPEGVEPGADENAVLTSGFGLAVGAAGVVIALLAPVLGQRSDAAGRRKLNLAIATGLLVLVTALLFFVEADYAFFWYGAILVGIGSVFSEIAGVNYNGLLVRVSTPKTVGQISGLGWGFGYLGGIVALVIVIVMQQNDWLGIPTEDGLHIRIVALGCAVWTVVFSLPIFLNVPEPPAAADRPRVGFFASYVVLVKDIVRIFRETRPTFWFLLASAVFRDGLAGVFTFGAIIAAVVFGFSPDMVIIFGVAANLVAGVSTILAGRFDDRFGPRAVIITALAGLVVAGLLVFLLRANGPVIFWVFGLILCLFVGPAQAASRSFLARVTPAGREGEIFGLYATTGRAASFLSPLAWAGGIALFGSTSFGVLGIVLILLVGLVLMLFVRLPGSGTARAAVARRASAG